MSRVSSGCALPEKTFSSPNPVAIVSSPITGQPSRFGWGGRIRTFEYGIQSPAPYRLATPHRYCCPRHDLTTSFEEASLWGGREPAVQSLSLYDEVISGQVLEASDIGVRAGRAFG